MKVLYHGSNIIVKDPLVHIGRKELEFGPGFYLTNLREQAERWARRVCVIQNTNQPYLSRYTLDDKAFANAHCRTFEAYDMEWLDFVLKCRSNDSIPHDYDLVIGPTADDNTTLCLKYYFDGIYGKVGSYDAKELLMKNLEVENLGVQYYIGKQDIADKLILRIKDEAYLV